MRVAISKGDEESLSFKDQRSNDMLILQKILFTRQNLLKKIFWHSNQMKEKVITLKTKISSNGKIILFISAKM